MELDYKPDFEEARRRWDAFWEGEIIGRPCLHIVVPKDGREAPPWPPRLAGLKLGFRKAIEMYEAYASARTFMAEAIPYFVPTFGPDQFASFLGAKLNLSEESADTTWVDPFVEDWEAAMPLAISEENESWRRMQEYVEIAAEISEGRYLVSQLDLHSNMDALSAIRGPERLCMDLLDQPDVIDRAMAEVRPYHGRVYDRVYEKGRMQERGTIGGVPLYSRGEYAVIQCDFICMICPDMARRFVIPAVAEEAAHGDCCVFHYDGPAALVHFDDICGIGDIAVVQYVPGAGGGGHIDCLDLLKRFQAAGKGLQVNGAAEQVKAMHRELKPEKVLYIVTDVPTEAAGAELIRWFERNT